MQIDNKICFFSLPSRMQHIVENQLLNDDCVLHIFKSLTVNDLCSVAQVSKQFQTLAQYTFKMKFNNFKLQEHFEKINISKLKALFIHFGKFIKHLEVSASQYKYDWNLNIMETYTLWLIKQNCPENQLRTLKLAYYNRIGRNFKTFRSILTNLEVLEFKCVALPFSICQLLTKLPNVKELTVKDCSPRFPITHFARTIHNPNLQILKLNCSEDFHTIDVLEHVDVHFPSLKELQFRIIPHLPMDRVKYTHGLEKLANVQTLKKLDIDFELNLPIDHFFNKLHENGIELEHFQIRHCVFNSKSINNLCKLKSIKKLALSRNLRLTPAHLIQLAIELPNLEAYSVLMNGVNIPTITEIVQNAKELLKAEFVLIHDEMFTTLSLNRLIDIVIEQKKQELFQLYIHNFFGRPTDENENTLLRNNAQNNHIQIQRHHIVHSSVFFD